MAHITKESLRRIADPALSIASVIAALTKTEADNNIVKVLQTVVANDTLLAIIATAIDNLAHQLGLRPTELTPEQTVAAVEAALSETKQTLG